VLQNCVAEFHNCVTFPKVHLHRKRNFLFQFNSAKDQDNILGIRPLSYNYKPFLLRHWPKMFDFEEDVLRVLFYCG